MCEQVREGCDAQVFECPVTEFRERGCDVEVGRLTSCYDQSREVLVSLLDGLPPCAEWTREVLLGFGERDLPDVRSCDLVDFQCEQTLDVSVEVATPSTAESLPRACRGFEGVCGRCALRACERPVRDCCGDSACVDAWSAYDACVANAWNGEIATYGAAQATCREREIGSEGLAADMYSCRQAFSELSCHAQCPVFDGNE